MVLIVSHHQARNWLRGLAARCSSFRASAATAAGHRGIGTGIVSHHDHDHGGSSPIHWNRHAEASSRHASSFSSQAVRFSDQEPTISTVETDHHHDVKVVVGNNGGLIHIQFANHDEKNDNNDPTTYHASWLWSNDPRGVLLPSGQRASTPGQYCSGSSRPRIQDASIIYCNIEQHIIGENNNRMNGKKIEERIRVPGPTFGDSCHPLAIYGNYPPWISAKKSTRFDDKASSKEDRTNTCRPYLKIVWSTPSTPQTQSEKNATSSSIYDLEWLQRFQYDDTSRLRLKGRTEVTPANAVRKGKPPLCYSTSDSEVDLSSLHRTNNNEVPKHDGKTGLMHVNYHSIITDDGQIGHEGLFQLLNSIFRDGAAILSNTPHSATANTKVYELCQTIDTMSEEELPVGKVARAMSGGDLSHGSLYGNIFHVRVGERNANNIAYTSNALPPHLDLAYYESPPGMQLLHCCAMGKGVVGGESMLIDAMAAAHKLRELRPESFETLVQCPATFVKQRDGACMTYRRPHIVLAEGGEGMGMRTMDREITAVFWSPPFEGPVCLPPGQVDRYYEAYADFERLLDDMVSVDGDEDELSRYAHEFTWEHKLNSGDMLVFNNRRMLHARRAFSSAAGVSFEDSQRHLVGCYTNIDDTLNSYRVLLRERGSSTFIRNVGNGTNITP